MAELHELFTSHYEMQQKLHYNNPQFYCYAVRSDFASDIAYTMPEHWHEDIEFLIVTDGLMEYSVNGEKVILHQGEGICVNSRRIHSNRSPKGESSSFVCTIIEPSFLCASPYIEQKYVRPVIGQGSFDYLLLNDESWTKNVKDELLRMFSKVDAEKNELEIIEVYFRILRIFHENMNLQTTLKNPSMLYSDAFKDMVTCIMDHYAEKISLEEISKAGNVGKTLCAKLFKKYTGKTPGDYLIHYRISKSMDLLTNSDFSIREIAFACGFNSPSYYTKTFREIIGCAPYKFREKTRDSYNNADIHCF